MRREHAARERLERDGVAGIAHDSQGGDHVLDDVVLDQRAATRQPAGNPRADEASLEVLADLVAAVQNRIVAPSQAGRRAVGKDILEQPRGFFFFISECERAHLVRRLLLRAELLLEQLGILRQHPPRGLEDLARAAAVLVQHNGPVDLVVAAEADEHVWVRPRPGEDRLLVIDDREEVAVRRRQALQEVVLDRVHVLELVHQEIVPARRDRIGDAARRAQQRLGLRDEIVEVQHVAVRQPGGVLAIEARVVSRQLTCLDPVPAEPVQQRTPLLQRHAQPAQDDLLVLLVGYPEPLAQARRLGVLAQQGQAQRVDRAPRDAVRAVPQGVLQPDRNLLGRPVRERDRADALRRDAKRADEMVDAGDEAERLPGAGSRHHEDGAEGCCDGAALLGQGVELHAGESRRRGAERLLKQPFPRSRRLTGKPSTRHLMLPGLPLLAAVTLAAQVADPRPPRPAPEPPPPTRVAATRATQPPAIDGRDDDAVWREAPPITAFQEWRPSEGGPPKLPTEAKIAYDAANLYVFVRAFDPHPDSIITVISRRDYFTHYELICLILDPYHYRRTRL